MSLLESPNIAVNAEPPVCITYIDATNLPIKDATFNVIHINARNLGSAEKFPLIENLVASSGVSFDAIAVSETWFENEAQAQSFALEGFTQLNHCRATRPG